ncbi:MAG: molybdopterin-binding protein [bacterium]|nr:molybdopterin-binding protein [bacterium]
MRRVEVVDAVGLALGHDITEIKAATEPGGKKIKRVAFKRGHVIAESDIARLLDLGKSAIFVVEEGDTEMHEDDAALKVSPLAAGLNVEFDKEPREGKINFRAAVDGVFRVDADRLYRINRLAIPTLPTLPNNFPVKAGQQVAGFRIIPLTCDPAIIDQVVAELPSPLLSVEPYVIKTAAVIVTGSEVFEGRIKDGFLPRLQKTLEPFGVAVTHNTILPDDREQITAEVRLAIGKCDLVFVTGGTSVDPDDVTVMAVQDAGVHCEVRGMPVQPGNNFTVGYAGQVPVCAVPAATLFHRATALDILLPRLLARVPITAEDIYRMGCGGLAQSTSDKNFPDCTFGMG